MVDDIVNAKGIAESIYRTVLQYSRSGVIPLALADLLFRRAPRITGVAAGEPVAGSGSIEDVKRAVSGMNNTVLCIQGPPGAGKTYTASHTIVELLRRGKRVGITSNSHKAIENLLDAIGRECQSQRVHLNAAKVGGLDYVRAGVKHFKDGGAFWRGDFRSFNVVAGTAWLFSAEDAVGLVDWLFIDEAGQVCLANVVGVAPATRNIVMLGDQMQLEQPCQGTHPEDSAKSCLEYYLQEHATIPPELGIFLATTFRMHPELCALISSAVYENRLVAEAGNVNRQLVPPAELGERFKKRAGVWFVPVVHEGNTQASEEEADEIALLVADLLKCKISDKSGVERQMMIGDILIVAPYNMQVRMIQERVPGAQVASVDKFQGREAAVVILSMCASDGNASPRGVAFLFNKNRLNVALSRAKALAIVVGHPGLADTACSSLGQVKSLNFFNKIVESGSSI